MIQLVELVKYYGRTPALRGVNLKVEAGELFVLLGPNGAGKTTLIKILTTLLRPTAGEAYVAGLSVLRSPQAVKERIGYLPDVPELYGKLTGCELLEFLADLHRVGDRHRILELLERMELQEAAHRFVETYSLGMRKKLALAGALLHRPEVLLLDEPTGSLDPRSARVVKDLLRELCQAGTTVFMTTHILEVAAQLADRVGILDRGRLLACGAVAELLAEHRCASLEDAFLALTGTGEGPEGVSP
ncbi:MAG: ABC transporter [Candidatus Poribacteria bacterium]|nr:MAG: ABC transporter [Candidatus Poribacteria bacterium]